MFKRVIKDLEDLKELLLYYDSIPEDLEIRKIDNMIKYLRRADRI